MKLFAAVYLLLGALIIGATNPAGFGLVVGAVVTWVLWPLAILWRLHGSL